jgi:hypothetical protein
MGSSKLNVRLAFNDYNEISRDVYIRLFIESQNIKIQTKADYIPVNPINLVPGSPILLNGNELYNMLDYANIDVIGSSRENLIKTGRLPEGIYSFSAEIYDYKSRQPISLKSSATANLRLNDPPVLVLPKTGSVIKPQEVQNITFQWQVNNIDPGTVQYQLALYEIAVGADPLSAIDNGLATQIFQSDNTDLNSFNYDASAPLLTKGKRYAVTISANSTSGQQIFRNNGKSQIYWFYYGYPEGGNIPLIFPTDKYNFSIRSTKYFEWDAPDNLTINQPVVFKFKIAKYDGTDANKSIEGTTWYDEEYAATYIKRGNYCQLPKSLEPKTDYVWQVKAWSDDQMVAKSKVYTFSGPPIIEEFFAGIHKVEVTSTDNSNMADLSGWGRIQLIEGGVSTKIRFEHLNISNTAGINALYSGTIYSKLDSFPVITLTPKLAENKEARFIADSVRIDKNGIDIKGTVLWDFPFAVKSANKPIVRSVPYWLSYNTLKVTGVAPLDPNNDFKLLDPGNMRMKLDETSLFLIYENVFRLEFNGSVELPSNVEGTNSKLVYIPFQNVEQLFYIVTDTLNLSNNIKLVPNTAIDLEPSVAHIDLSEKKSPFAFAGEPSWKGVYFEKFRVVHDKRTDYNGQLSCTNKYTHRFVDSNKSRAWVDAWGLNAIIDHSFETDNIGKFNTFPCDYKSYYIESNNSIVSKSYYKGTIKIPILSQSEDFLFTVPISIDGFQTGYLDETLDGKKYIFNDEGGDEQRMILTINRAVFADQERLDMNLTIEWPFLNVTFQTLDGFKVYGNYEIGFLQAQGATSLCNQLNTSIKGYQITLDHIGAGREENLYAIGASAKIVMEDDVSGENGAPIVNLYSIQKNALLSGQFIARAQFENTATPSSSGNSSLGSMNSFVSNQKSLAVSSLAETLNNLSKAQFKTKDSLNITQSLSGLHNLFKNSTTETTETTTPVTLTESQKAQLKDIVDKMAKKISAPLAVKAGSVTKSVAKTIDSTKNIIINQIRTYSQESILTPLQQTAESLITDDPSSATYQKVKEVLVKICIQTVNESVESLINSFDKIIQTDIILPIANSGENVVYNSTSAGLYVITENLVTKGGDITFDNLLNEASNAVLKSITSIDISTKLIQVTNDLKNQFLDPQNLFNLVTSKFAQSSTEIIGAVAVGAANDFLNNVAGSVPIVAAVQSCVKLDASNLGDKIKNGEFDKIIKFDPSHIHIESNIAIIDGEVKFFNDDPVWGDSWQANLNATILIEPVIVAEVRYINGHKKVGSGSDTKFWFLKLKANGLNIPLAPLPLILDGAAGTVYHHMKKTAQEDVYLPDSLTNYGVGLKTYFYDAISMGNAAIFDAGLELQFQKGGFIMDLTGNIYLGNVISKGKIVRSEITTNGLIEYSSLDHRFLGNMIVDYKKEPFLCGGGELNIDISSTGYNVTLGTRKKPIFLRPMCSQVLESNAWLDFRNQYLDCGLQLNIPSVYCSSGWIGFPGIKFRGYSYSGWAFQAATIIEWQPSWKINEAQVAISYRVAIGVEYSTFLKDGHKDLASVEVGGIVKYESQPEAKITGTVYGKASVMGYNVSFDLSVSKTL